MLLPKFLLDWNKRAAAVGLGRGGTIFADKMGHTLYATSDSDAPNSIRDANGEVALQKCRTCGKAEIELSQPCEWSIHDLTETISDDSVYNHPAYYGGADNPYEAIKVIEAWGLGFNLGNTAKYISRAEHKANALEDLKKARWYLDREIANRKSKQ